MSNRTSFFILQHLSRPSVPSCVKNIHCILHRLHSEQCLLVAIQNWKKKTFLTKLFHVQHKRKSVPFQHKRLSNDVSRLAESEENSALRVLPKGSQELVPGASAGGIGAPMRPPLCVIVYAVSKFNISGIQRVDSHSDTRLRPRANSILR